MRYLSLFLLVVVVSTSAVAAPSAASFPLCFIENKGQLLDQHGKPRADIDFVLHSGTVDIFVGCGRIEYQWKLQNDEATRKAETNEPSKPSELRLQRIDVCLVGSSEDIVPQKQLRQAYREQYYLPQFGEKGAIAHAYAKIIYQSIYPGIDWVIYIENNSLEYDLVVHEGADASQIKIKYSGADDLKLLADGSLAASAILGGLSEAKPVSYQPDGSLVASAFKIRDGHLSFDIAPYSGTLIIDPVIDWSTYFLGSQSATFPGMVTTFNQEHIYLCGYTTSPGLATTGAHQSIYAGNNDGFLAKFDSAGQRIWTTYYGGAGSDLCVGVVCDMASDIYICGSTNSVSGIATTGTHQPQLAADQDAFLVKFDSSGIRIWGTYFGGEGGEVVRTICIAGDNEPYICGSTTSDTGIATTGTYQITRAGGGDMFLAKFNQTGMRIWATYYGGPGEEAGFDCAHDQIESIYLLGWTRSTSGIATVGSHQPNYYGGQCFSCADACLARFNDLGQLAWATYYGGEGDEMARALACDGAGAVYFTGNTGDGGSFPPSLLNISTPGSYQPSASNSTNIEAFLVKFDSTGQRIWGTYFGGIGNDQASPGLVTDQWSNLYFTGRTTSSTNITTLGAWQTSMNSIMDDFVVKFDSSGSLLWSSYFGGDNNESATSCSFDGHHSLYITGWTESATGIATNGAFQTTNPPGYVSTYLARIDDCFTPDTPALLIGNLVVCEGDTVTYSVPPVNGAVSYNWSLPNGWTGSSTSSTITVVTGSTGGNISVIAQGYCANSQPLTAAVAVSSPTPVITAAGNVLSTGTYNSYQWYLNGNPISGATGQSYTVTQPGSYTVVVTDGNGCSGTSAQHLGLSQIVKEDDLLIFPNPAKDLVTVSGYAKDIRITNIHGQELMKIPASGLARDINISALQPGIYFVIVTDRHNKQTTIVLTKD